MNRRSPEINEDSQLNYISSPSNDLDDIRPQAMSSQINEPNSLDPLGDGEEFPDVDSLLRAPLSDGIRRGHKRAKTSHNYSRKKSRTGTEVTSTSIRNATEMYDASRVDGQDIFDIPPSPPQSGSSLPERARRGSRSRSLEVRSVSLCDLGAIVPSRQSRSTR